MGLRFFAVETPDYHWGTVEANNAAEALAEMEFPGWTAGPVVAEGSDHASQVWTPDPTNEVENDGSNRPFTVTAELVR